MNGFTYAKRADGSGYYTVNDDAPQWVKEAVRSTHSGDMPNDWIYSQCAAAFEACEEGAINLADLEVHQHADSQVDVYTRDLYQWAADMCLSDSFARASDTADDCGHAPDATAEDRLRAVQYFAVENIARIIATAYQENVAS